MMSCAEVVKQLIEKKDDLEKQIKELTEVVESQKGVGMTGPLLDTDQYPRADIDVASVRQARHSIICLQNDHQELMKQIEEGLYQVHAEVREQRRSTEQLTGEAMDVGATANAAEEDVKTTFARVDRVDAGSPAASAGLEVDDLLVKFGSMSAENFKSLQDVGRVVQHSVGKPVSVTLLRESEELGLTVTPQKWSGRGFLGCNIVPLT